MCHPCHTLKLMQFDNRVARVDHSSSSSVISNLAFWYNEPLDRGSGFKVANGSTILHDSIHVNPGDTLL
jgi:hypothetical protein